MEMKEIEELVKKHSKPIKPYFLPYDALPLILKGTPRKEPDPKLTKFAKMLKEAVKKLEKEG